MLLELEFDVTGEIHGIPVSHNLTKFEDIGLICLRVASCHSFVKR